MHKGLKLILFIILTQTAFVYSQSNKFLFQNYTSANGLPNNYIRCLYQDDNGYLWIGTRHGLSKFDGYEFTNYDRPSPTFTDPPYPSMIFEDTDLKLWVINHALLYTYEPKSDKFNLVREGNTMGMFDKSGNLWFPFFNGIYKLDAQKISQISPTDLKLICREKDNKLAVFENIDPRKIIKYAKVYQPKSGRNLEFNELGFALKEDSEGMIWCIVHSDGIYKLNPADGQFIHYLHAEAKTGGLSHNTVGAIFEENRNSLWFGTENGIDILHKNNETFTHIQNNISDKFSISNDKITSLLQDRSGNLWVGTKYGLNRLYKSKFSHLNNFNDGTSLLSNNAISFCEDDKNHIWVSTSLAVEILDSNLKSIEQLQVHENDAKSLNAAPQYIYQDKQKRIWIGTWMGGLVQYHPENKSFEYYRHNPNDATSISGEGIFNLFEDSKNNFWISYWTGNGIDLFDREKKQFKNYLHKDDNPNSLSENFVSMVFEDSRSNLWVGTSMGLNLLVDIDKGNFKRFVHKDADSSSVSGNYINCIFESAEKELWIATDSGLNKFSYETGTFVSFTGKNELLKEDILGILEDNAGNLWISKSKGLSKVIFTANRTKISSVQNFDFGKVNANEFNVRSCLKQKNGHMLFGGLNGIVAFSPDSIRQNLIAPKTVITKLKIFNKEVNIGDKIQNKVILKSNLSTIDNIQLSYQLSTFSLEFAGLHFENPEANKYKYKLEGFDNDWTYTDASARNATYTNLDGGEYTFQVVSANSDGIWNEKPTTLHIVIVPPFWKTLWFRILVILFIGALIFSFVRARIYLLKKQKNDLQKQVIARTSEIVHQKENIEKQNELLENQKHELLAQSSKIERMNQLLQKHNIELVENVKELSEARVMQKLIDYSEFKKTFKNEDDCYKILANLKWADGYSCKRCKSIHFSSKEPFVRRCRKCNYRESATSFTIFHHLRFPIDKAFYILILTSSGREINVSQLSNTLALRLKTCWIFHNKVKTIMSQRKRVKNSKEGWIELILLGQKDKKHI